MAGEARGTFGETDQFFVMPNNPSLISGVVYDAAGRRFSGARLSLVEGPLALPDMALLTSSDGAYLLSAPIAGLYRIACHAEGFSPASASVSIASARNVTLDFHLKPLM